MDDFLIGSEPVALVVLRLRQGVGDDRGRADGDAGLPICGESMCRALMESGDLDDRRAG
jgi:hypothetical protein